MMTTLKPYTTTNPYGFGFHWVQCCTNETNVCQTQLKGNTQVRAVFPFFLCVIKTLPNTACEPDNKYDINKYEEFH